MDISQKAKNELMYSKSTLGDLEGIKKLVMAGADVKSGDGEGLVRACAGGFLEVVRFFVLSGVPIDVQNNICIGSAAQNGYIEIVNFLYSVGANLDNSHKDIDDNVKKALFTYKENVLIGREISGLGEDDEGIFKV